MSRAIVLGASNVSLSLRTITREFVAVLPPPLDLYVAAGHGRSLKHWTTVGPRSISGLLDCSLWDALDDEAHASSPSVGIITDIGNDLLYGWNADQLLTWLEECIQKLRQHVEQLVITHLPVFSFQKMQPLMYYTAARFFMPNVKPHDFDLMKRFLNQITDTIEEFATRYELTTVKQQPAWYGFDPIHVKRSRRTEAWQTYIAPLKPASDSQTEQTQPGYFLPFARPAEMKLFGRDMKHPQPAIRRNGLQIHLH